jgi:hypothetical protein
MDKILLLSGLNRRSNMACKMKFDPRTGVYVKKCSKKRKKRLGSLGAESLRSRAKGFLTLGGLDMKAMVYTGALGALGALASQLIWKQIGESLKITDATTKSIAEMVTGAGIALVCVKLFKQPKLGAALAIGPIVSGLVTILKAQLPASWNLAGIPMVSRVGLKAYPQALPSGVQAIGSIPQAGSGIPNWTKYPKSASFMGAV